jgi:hypothetical protein
MGDKPAKWNCTPPWSSDPGIVLYRTILPPEQFIFRALRRQMLWPSIHAAVDVYQRRRASSADSYELIWRLIHICECTVITLAAAAMSRIRDLGKDQEFLRLRERCYGITWNATEASLEKGLGALDGSIDKWIEIVQYIANCPIEGSKFVSACQLFLLGVKEVASEAMDPISTSHRWPGYGAALATFHRTCSPQGSV